MFCHKCGNKSIEGAGFCFKCGTRLVAGDSVQQTPSEPIVVHVAHKPAPSNTQPEHLQSIDTKPDVQSAPAINDKTAIIRELVAPIVNDKTAIIRELVGKNADYYLEQFAKIDRGEKSFNISALLIAPVVMLYRKQFTYFAKIVLPVYALILICFVVTAYAFAFFNFGLVMQLPVIWGAATVFGITMAVVSGMGFNKSYRDNLQRIIDENKLTSYSSPVQKVVIKKHAPQAIIPVLGLVSYAVLMGVMNVVVSAIALNALFGGLDSSEVADAFNQVGGSNETSNHAPFADSGMPSVILDGNFISEPDGPFFHDNFYFTFDYPGDWHILDPLPSIMHRTHIVSDAPAGEHAVFSILEMVIWPLELDTGDEELIRAAWDERAVFNLQQGELFDIADLVLYDRLGRTLFVRHSLFGTDRIRINMYFEVDNSVFEIEMSFPEANKEFYLPIFDAIIDSFRIVEIEPSMDDASVVQDVPMWITVVDTWNRFSIEIPSSWGYERGGYGYDLRIWDLPGNIGTAIITSAGLFTRDWLISENLPWDFFQFDNGDIGLMFFGNNHIWWIVGSWLLELELTGGMNVLDENEEIITMIVSSLVADGETLFTVGYTTAMVVARIAENYRMPLNEGTFVAILERLEGGWLYIMAANITGYVLEDFISIYWP